eukprot:CAMPEP_0170491834 /NCGR_PEP_ID=MMETSP0208-20121228/11281_1 /TAXON_ID=197538 /ORGANISM="Strombidium inclinatum, Strain S3" /LENGTH=100 /DNA_ID=CAMNT_0010767475 /DNA_START=1025 /DNA_END=1327 /DNA_ORIENTATION=+
MPQARNEIPIQVQERLENETRVEGENVPTGQLGGLFILAQGLQAILGKIVDGEEHGEDRQEHDAASPEVDSAEFVFTGSKSLRNESAQCPIQAKEKRYTE